MPGEVNCIYTKVLIPYLERHVGPEAVAEVCRVAGRSREYLMADHNWISLDLADELMGLGRTLMGVPDPDEWARGLGEFAMDWKPREERSYLGTYSMGIGAPRGIYEKLPLFYRQVMRFAVPELEHLGRRSARLRFTPRPGARMPLWACRFAQANLARFPTNWGLPRARVVERQCAVAGAPSCLLEVHWRNPSLGRVFWSAAATGAATSAGLWLALDVGRAGLDVADALLVLPALTGVAVGYALRERRRRRHTQRLMDLQSEEIIYSNNELEKKFGELETRIAQLSLLIDLAGAVNATLDPERIYERALDRLVHGMSYPAAYLFLVDHRRGVLRGHRMAAAEVRPGTAFEAVEVPLDPQVSASARVAVTGRPLLVNDVEHAEHPVHTPVVRAFDVRSFVAVPLRVKGRVVGVLNVVASEPDRFGDTDLELLAAVADHVALALDRAESFQTIEELSRGLEEKVRVRTEQLHGANEELAAAYRELQAAQVQLVQREKMASVGQLVAGIAHELNNPIGFVASNAATLEDFVHRLRGMLESYRARAAALPEPDRQALADEWQARKVDYALRYLDPMILGIREGAERTRKIVRDLRVFARGDDDVRQPVDLHEELESSLTLLGHLLKDRVAVERKYGDLPAVQCVRSQIDQVLLNLLANAAQAITGPGTITIETRGEDGWAVVVIRDSGPGIAPGVIGRIFDPFFTTKPIGEGTGLGLSISYEIVKKHGGQIRVESPPGQGATFEVRIPLTPETPGRG
jgi:two-component system NtrC family sensor kinase